MDEKTNSAKCLSKFVIAHLPQTLQISVNLMQIMRFYFKLKFSVRKLKDQKKLFWSVFSRIRTEYGKIRTRKTPYLDTFHTVNWYPDSLSKNDTLYQCDTFPGLLEVEFMLKYLCYSVVSACFNKSLKSKQLLGCIIRHLKDCFTFIF